ncbi:MAG: hypothetical protein V2A78_08710 [bacterium]
MEQGGNTRQVHQAYGSGKRSLLRYVAIGVLAAALVFSFGTAYATRLIATPYADTLPEGKTSVWQFFLRESRSTNEWRTLNRLDLGLTDRLELGIFVISPPKAPVDTWVNLQYRINKETKHLPVFSVGVWDATRIKSFSGQQTGGSFFIAAGKTFNIGRQSSRYLKLSLGGGTNRLDGLFGGADLRFAKNTGILVEYVPPNLRLPNTDSMDVGLYHWISPQWRVRASWMGGNPMFDVFYTWTIGKK